MYFLVAIGVFVWVDESLELKEFATEVAGGDFEGRGWWGARGERLCEDCIVVGYVRGAC